MLYIAEKPELARAIAEALGGGAKRKGYYECGQDTVTWCFGHMLRLYEPEEYDPAYKKWSLDQLPMIFTPWKKKPINKSKEQLTTIVGLLREATTVVHAGDPDAEGQLLVGEVLQFAQFTGQVKRVLINDNTPAAVKKALADLRDNADFKGLSQAAEARQVCDQHYGFNLTRLYTLAARREGYDGVLSVGRVQTPILGLVVRRDRENSGHQMTLYYEVKGVFRAGDTTFPALYRNKQGDPQDEKGRLTDAVFANTVAAAVDGKPATVKTVETKDGETPPPLPYNLLKLQTDASRLHGMAPDAVKEITQTLREKHRLITYNRSDSQYLPKIQHADAPEVIAAIADNVPEFEPYFSSADPTIKSRAFNSAKVSAHHAIIPTQARADFKKLSLDEKRVYNLIARAYLVQFMPNHAWRRTIVTIAAESHDFSRSARVTLKNGWRDFFESDPEADDAEPDCALPELTSGQEIHCDSCAPAQKETKPRQLYSMASLLEDLTRVAQYVRDEKLRQSLIEKDKGKAGEHGGIGTPATRDEILKTLFERGFLETRKSGRTAQVVSTKAGQEFYDILPDQAKFPDLTALWHEQQREIEMGKLALDAFVEANAAYIGGEVARVLDQGLGLRIEKHPCPECGSAMFKRTNDKGAYWACSEYPRCRATLPDDNGKPGTRKILIGEADPSVLCPGCGKPMRIIHYAGGPFYGCTGFPDCKRVVRIKDGKPDFSPTRPSVSEKHKCQQCGNGLVRRSGKDGKPFWGCSTYPQCKASYPDHDGKPNYVATAKVTS